MSAARPVPDPDAASAPFWEACARHELTIQTCANCGAHRHPPRPMCPRCRSFEHTFEPWAGEATVWSWVVAHPPLLPVFAEIAPYTVCVVELGEGVRMIGRWLGDTIEPGMAAGLVWEDVEDGVALAAWAPA